MTTALYQPGRSKIFARKGKAAPMLMGVALALLAGHTQADMPEPKPPVPADTLPVVTVRPLKDTGGLSEKGVDGQPLNARLTTALVSYLTRRGKGQFKVVDGREKSAPAKTAGLQLTLEGELSHVETKDEDHGPYMCVVRLTREDKTHPIVGQWAGMAQTLRYLTGNLKHDSRISDEGLVGELGNRVAHVTTGLAGGDPRRAYKTLVEDALKLKRVTADVTLPVNNMQTPAKTLTGGSAYSVKVVSQDAGEVFLIDETDGHLKPLFVPEEGKEIEIAPDRPALLPPGATLTADMVKQNATLTFVALVRRKIAPKPTPDPKPKQNNDPKSRNATKPESGNKAFRANAFSVEPRFPSVSAIRLASPDTPPRNPPMLNGIPPVMKDNAPSPVQTLPPVEVVNGGSMLVLTESVDIKIARLLAIAATDPPGTWVAQRFTVQVTPPKTDKNDKNDKNDKHDDPPKPAGHK